MRRNQVKNLPYLKDTRRGLRRNSTPAEQALWEVLRNSNFHGRRFRRQHSIEHYIADFYCASERLVIEVDGEVHADPQQAASDKERDTRLASLGYTTLRFTNTLVLHHMETVLDKIKAHFKA